MAVLNNILAGAAGQTGGAGGYTIERSLRFNSDDSAHLSRTPSVEGNRRTWTWAGWVKRSALTTALYQSLFANNSGANAFLGFVNGGDGLLFYDSVAGGNVRYTSNVLRDPSAWYHVVFNCDTTKATASERARIYVNGTEASYSVANDPALNSDLVINSTIEHQIGGQPAVSRHFSGYLVDIHFIDGQALDPTDFGEFDDNGVWQPIAYTGTYGTNGFHLDFSDNTNTTTIAEDSSGNGNDWTANNISVTAGAGNDSLFDSPTNGTQTDTGAGGEVSGNYATYNALFKAANSTYSNGNLEHLAATPVGSYESGVSTIGVSSGKWYAEFTVAVLGNDAVAGVSTVPYNILNRWPGGNIGSIGYEAVLGRFYKDNVAGQNVSTYNVNDVIGVALDLDNGGIWFSKNGTWQGTGSPNPATNTSPAYTGLTGTHFFASGTGGSGRIIANFGQRAFAYSAPSGFKALCTANLDDPTIADGSTAMDVALYTGNGSTQTISGLGLSPDFVWIKNRGNGTAHVLFDTVRGPTKYVASSSTTSEITNTSTLTAFTSDGFSVGNNGGVNQSSVGFVAWTWDAGTSTVTNTDGSTTANVRANASTGFSIVSYTGTSANATVGHGLNAAPEFIVIKNRDRAIDWAVYHAALGATQNLKLNRDYTAQSVSSYFNDTDPTSSVVSLGAAVATNYTGEDIIAYCFAPVEGYSAFGSYTGNGSTDGTFIYTGFRPRWILVKGADGPNTYNWFVQDTKRNPENLTTQYLIPNLSNVEGSTGKLDILSNGFKWRTSSTGLNESGTDYIYAAFAENPFKTARAR